MPLTMQMTKDFMEGLSYHRDDLGEKLQSSCLFILAVFVYILIFLVLPLVPVTLLALGSFAALIGDSVECIEDDGKIEQNINADKLGRFKKMARVVRQNLGLLFLYLLIAYGGMGRMMISQSHVGEISKSTLFLTWGLAGWLLILPLLVPLGMVAAISVADLISKEYDADYQESEMDRKLVQRIRHGMILSFKSVLCPCHLSNARGQ